MSEPEAVEQAFEETVRALVSPAVNAVAQQVAQGNADLRFKVDEYKDVCERQAEHLGGQVEGLRTLLEKTREELAATERSDALEASLGQLRSAVLDAQRVITAAPEQFLAIQEGHLAAQDRSEREKAQALMEAVTAQVKTLDDPTLRQAVAQLEKDVKEGNERLAAVARIGRSRSNLLFALTSVSILLTLLLVWLVVKGSA